MLPAPTTHLVREHDEVSMLKCLQRPSDMGASAVSDAGDSASQSVHLLHGGEGGGCESSSAQSSISIVPLQRRPTKVDGSDAPVYLPSMYDIVKNMFNVSVKKYD